MCACAWCLVWFGSSLSNPNESERLSSLLFGRVRFHVRYLPKSFMGKTWCPLHAFKIKPGNLWSPAQSVRTGGSLIARYFSFFIFHFHFSFSFSLLLLLLFYYIIYVREEITLT